MGVLNHPHRIWNVGRFLELLFLYERAIVGHIFLQNWKCIKMFEEYPRECMTNHCLLPSGKFNSSFQTFPVALYTLPVPKPNLERWRKLLQSKSGHYIIAHDRMIICNNWCNYILLFFCFEFFSGNKILTK